MKKFIIFLLLALSICIFAQDKKQNKTYSIKNGKKIFTYKDDTEETPLEVEDEADEAEEENTEYWETYIEDDTVENDMELYEEPIEDDTEKNMSDFSE